MRMDLRDHRRDGGEPRPIRRVEGNDRGARGGEVVDIRQSRRDADRRVGEVYLDDADDGHADRPADGGDTVDPLDAQARRPFPDHGMGECDDEVGPIERPAGHGLAGDDEPS
jgi:hypothetical protein